MMLFIGPSVPSLTRDKQYVQPAAGAGKTTLIQLMLRFYDPISGQVSIDGQDLRTVKQTSLRRQIGLVMQETILLSGTIRENMLFAREDATDEEITMALQHAEAPATARCAPNNRWGKCWCRRKEGRGVNSR